MIFMKLTTSLFSSYFISLYFNIFLVLILKLSLIIFIQNIKNQSHSLYQYNNQSYNPIRNLGKMNTIKLARNLTKPWFTNSVTTLEMDILTYSYNKVLNNWRNLSTFLFLFLFHYYLLDIILKTCSGSSY